MRKAILFIFLIAVTLPAMTQRSADYGVSGGFTTYLGEINPTNIFYNPGPAIGFFYRYNFNPRQAVRANLMGSRVSGSDLDFNNIIQQTRAHSFSGMLGELGVTYEFNFFPFTTIKGRKIDYTPYLAAGAALSMNNTVNFTLFPSIPFSAGFKINIAQNMGLEFEYGFRKTFYDNFDGLSDMVDQDDLTWTHNNDWYSFMGVSLTWKMYSKLSGCPAFADLAEEKKRKR